MDGSPTELKHQRTFFICNKNKNKIECKNIIITWNCNFNGTVTKLHNVVQKTLIHLQKNNIYH